MAVKLRLRRVGAKKQPAYRIVAADSRAPRDGRFIEIIGAYNPLTSPATVQINNERALYWLRNGAQPTDVVKKIFVTQGVWAQFTGEAMPEAPAAPAEPEVPVQPMIEETPLIEDAAIVEPVEAVEAAEEAPVAEEAAAPAEEAPAPAEEAPAPAEEASAVEETVEPAEEKPAAE